MAAKITRLLRPANPTIDQVCEEFLGEQRQRLTPRTDILEYGRSLRLRSGSSST